MHSSEAFYALDDRLETAAFSVLIGMMKGAGRLPRVTERENVLSIQPPKAKINAIPITASL